MLQTQAWDVSERDKVVPLAGATPSLESRLEDWIDQDATILGAGLMIIGRQVSTDFGTYIDLLGLNADGDLVIIELKRDQTLRETVAQALEYAAWCSQLGYDDVVRLASAHFRTEREFRERYGRTFDQELPETLNQAQQGLLVAPEIADSTRAVIEYLSETYSVPINAATFSLFPVNGRSVLVRQSILPEEEAARRRPASAKSRPAATIEELLERAEANGVRPIAEKLWALHPHFVAPWRYANAWGFAQRDRTQPSRTISVMSVFPTGESLPQAVVVSLAPTNLESVYGKSPEECREFLAKVKAQVAKQE